MTAMTAIDMTRSLRREKKKVKSKTSKVYIYRKVIEHILAAYSGLRAGK